MGKNCIFCQIIAQEQPASVIFEDDLVLAMVPLHAVSPESCVIVSKEHVDHFQDLPEQTAARIMLLAQRVAKKMMQVYSPE